MNFQIASDLHIDTKGGLHAPDYTYPSRTAPILVLAGDVCSASDPDYESILQRVAAPFKLVFYVPGNHEYYGSGSRSVAQVDSMIEKACFSIGNIVYLNKRRVDIRGIAYIGATLWTNCPTGDTSLMNDFNQIQDGRFGPRDENKLHKEHREWLKKTLKSAKRDGCVGAVVVSHHAPVGELADLSVRSERSTNFFPYYYATDMGNIPHDPFVQVWVHGHTHVSYRVQLDEAGTIFATNALGYDGERTGYTDRAVLKI